MSPEKQKTISVGIAVIGVLLVAMMVITEGELGALPLGLVVIGVVGYLSGRVRQRRSGSKYG